MEQELSTNPSGLYEERHIIVILLYLIEDAVTDTSVIISSFKMGKQY